MYARYSRCSSWYARYSLWIWIVWLVVNVANIVLYISAGLYVMPVVSLLYIANGVWSLVSWRKKFETEE